MKSNTKVPDRLSIRSPILLKEITVAVESMCYIYHVSKFVEIMKLTIRYKISEKFYTV
jgi:hypothetical protein